MRPGGARRSRLRVAAAGNPCIICANVFPGSPPAAIVSETNRGIPFCWPEESAHVSRGRLLLKLELASDPAMLCVVRNALAQLAETLGFSEAECRAIVLAVDEAMTN